MARKDPLIYDLSGKEPSREIYDIFSYFMGPVVYSVVFACYGNECPAVNGCRTSCVS